MLTIVISLVYLNDVIQCCVVCLHILNVLVFETVANVQSSYYILCRDSSVNHAFVEGVFHRRPVSVLLFHCCPVLIKTLSLKTGIFDINSIQLHYCYFCCSAPLC